MSVKWTEEQQKVIDTRNKNILVSAAAGSGKTAVLVERILTMITDSQCPVDIDHLLVVTFTNAAASEMRERIREALEEKAEQNPENMHLQRQLVLIHNAKITTIHSFCLQVLRNHFQTIGIDPAFRIADEGEVHLLEKDAVKEAVDAAYEEGTAEFYQFLEEFVTGKSDDTIEEVILDIYHFALGQPWPEKWLEECRRLYEKTDPEKEPEWKQYIVTDTRRLLQDMMLQIQAALAITQAADGPYPYEAALTSDMEMLKTLCDSGKDYVSFSEAFAVLPTFVRLSTKKDPAISAEKKQLVQNMRNSVKDALGSLKKKYYYDTAQVLQEEFYQSGMAIRVLTKLTEQFMEILQKKKTEKNVLDFSDMEHLALKILVQENNGEYQPSTIAGEYAEAFEEIMIDEYQDSNMVQEIILSSVSGKGGNYKNRFMVGDVKQSIYRFRLARPELFMEKYKTYQNESEDQVRIDLHRNFRSREEVLCNINYLFRQIMTEGLGGIHYDKSAALYPGAKYEQRLTEPDPFCTTEFYLLEADSSQKQREEALLIAKRILEIVGKEQVWDKNEGRYRAAEYRDIVILLRTMAGWSEVFGEVLTEQGIPCFTGSQKGYFSATEIRTVLSYLQILDNPRQDIPLAAVLHSPIGNLDEEELAQIRCSFKDESFLDCCLDYEEAGKDQVLQKKLQEFFSVYQLLRKESEYTPVHILIWRILDLTGYGEYAKALPAGAQRKANLNMLVEKAISYEATSYRGLYHFVRYIENLKKYEIDYGEANSDSETANTVRIMSIHKSKGLEFPVVFVSALGKQFNESDIRARVVLHPELGMGCDCVDTQQRTRTATLLKKTIQQKLDSENLGEELRVLYVALTRAKEKLILTGSVTDVEAKFEKWTAAAMHQNEQLAYSWLTKASAYLDWVVPALLRHPSAGTILEKVTGSQEGIYSLPDDTCKFHMEIVSETGQEEQLASERERQSIRMQEYLHMDLEKSYDEEAEKYLTAVFEKRYPYEDLSEIVAKLSVSQLKKLSHIAEEADAKELYQEETVMPLIPEFMNTDKQIVGAARGTLYHLFLEHLDYSRKDQLEIQLEEMISCGKMSEDEAKVLNLRDMKKFLASDTGKRMEKAALAGELHREQPFVYGIPANEIFPAWSKDETVIVQGIIDAYFTEGSELVVVDYKTDRVSEISELVQKYRPQLEYYARALFQLTGKKVKNCIIYSFDKGKDIVL